VLALARLWSVFDEGASQLLPEADVARIRHSFQGDCEGNPVLKKPLETLRVGGRLQIVDVTLEQQQQQQQLQQTGAQSAAQMLRGADNATLLAYIQRMETNFQQQLQAVRSEQLASRQFNKEQFNLIIANQRRFGGTTPQALSRANRSNSNTDGGTPELNSNNKWRQLRTQWRQELHKQTLIATPGYIKGYKRWLTCGKNTNLELETTNQPSHLVYKRGTADCTSRLSTDATRCGNYSVI